MAQFYFYYGAMNSGKSIELLKDAHNYHEENKHVILMTSATDTREKQRTIKSRIGISCKAVPIFKNTNVYDYAFSHDHVYCLLVDEAQFLTKNQVIQLAKVVDLLKIPVMAFGLKNDFQNNLFEGSKYLLLYADKIKEIKTVCWYCGHKATMNLRIHNHKPIYNGQKIQMGGNESYLPVCRFHYFHPNLER